MTNRFKDYSFLKEFANISILTQKFNIVSNIFSKR